MFPKVVFGAGQVLRENQQDSDLDLCLVAGGLKPAASDVIILLADYLVGVRRLGKQDRIGLIALQADYSSRFDRAFREFGVVYAPSQRKVYFDDAEPGVMGTRFVFPHFRVGRDDECLQRLVSAQDDEAIGMALGFPVGAVRAYARRVRENDLATRQGLVGKCRHPAQGLTDLKRRFRQSGIEPPGWYAYLNFVPETVDVETCQVDAPSMELAKSYQEYARTRHPGIAARVEARFRERIFNPREEEVEKVFIVK